VKRFISGGSVCGSAKRVATSWFAAVVVASMGTADHYPNVRSAMSSDELSLREKVIGLMNHHGAPLEATEELTNLLDGAGVFEDTRAEAIAAWNRRVSALPDREAIRKHIWRYMDGPANVRLRNEYADHHTTRILALLSGEGEEG
jgi:hypothetical protein